MHSLLTNHGKYAWLHRLFFIVKYKQDGITDMILASNYTIPHWKIALVIVSINLKVISNEWKSTRSFPVRFSRFQNVSCAIVKSLVIDYKRHWLLWHYAGRLFQCGFSLQWCHNEWDGISNHQPHGCLLDCLFRPRSKKPLMLCVTGLCAGHSPVNGEFHAQRASNAENVSIWWRHHVRMPSWSGWGG